MTTVCDIDNDQHCRRITEDAQQGRLTVAQAVKLALATGRLQGHYMSARHLAHEAGIVSDVNSARTKEEDCHGK
jgi:hypothetical protein